MGADATNERADDRPIAEVKALCGGAEGVLVTAVRKAFGQALGMLGKRGTMALVVLPPGSFELDIFDAVLTHKTIRGSIVAARSICRVASSSQAKGRSSHTVRSAAGELNASSLDADHNDRGASLLRLDLAHRGAAEERGRPGSRGRSRRL